MSSNIEIEKVCRCCGKVFTARKTTTECCSHKCSSTLYKARKRSELVGRAKTKNDKEIFRSKIDNIKDKPILTISQVAKLVGVSRTTVYQYITNRELPVMKLGRKTFVRADELFSRFQTQNLENIKPTSELTPILNVYTIEEIMSKYRVRQSWIYKVVREKKIPKVYKRGRCYYSQPDIDKHFSARLNCNEPITEWYSVEEAMKQFNLTRDQLYYYVKQHSVPKLKEGRYIKISKTHLDNIFNKPIIL